MNEDEYWDAEFEEMEQTDTPAVDLEGYDDDDEVESDSFEEDDFGSEANYAE